ncbi:fructosamine kinase family protein [Marinivivus vitaminiproducens]|uniref:fructosamine kinase family protein n=1 Tax=Marinivivus vitaminiproducens TaxID=3035935 RepID=UPI00279B36C9|nr:fructosamine kinase family protein [Geminicoccaceae bacterium SCSIO 64248]
MTAGLRGRIECVLGRPVERLEVLSGGTVTGAWRARLAGGASVVVKAGRGRFVPDQLATEGWMLAELGRRSALPVPEVLHAEDDLLIMSWIAHDAGGLDASAERHLAELLAGLHDRPAQGFGLERDTVIGPFRQPNAPSPSWLSFFRERRLLATAEAAAAEGAIDRALLGRLERLAARLDAFLEEPRHPSLLHGDVWSGNVLCQGGRIVGLVDPAIHHGHAEIELAFGTLFGPFGRTFFETYQALRPIAPGFFEVRRDLYNLYPLLVHVRLFGGGYLPPILRTLDRLDI